MSAPEEIPIPKPLVGGSIPSGVITTYRQDCTKIGAVF